MASSNGEREHQQEQAGWPQAAAADAQLLLDFAVSGTTHQDAQSASIAEHGAASRTALSSSSEPGMAIDSNVEDYLSSLMQSMFAI